MAQVNPEVFHVKIVEGGQVRRISGLYDTTPSLNSEGTSLVTEMNGRKHTIASDISGNAEIFIQPRGW